MPALFLLLAPIALLAQSSPQTCPVDATAKRHGPGSVLTVDGGAAGPSRSSVSLRLRPRDERRITGATVVVHALSLRGRALPVAGAAPDITREFRLQAGAGRDPEFQAGVRLDEPATVLWLDVTELRYSRGPAWQALQGAGCRVEPDNVVLVAALP